MYEGNYVSMFLASITANLPTLLVCCAALFITFMKWRTAPRAAMWSLVGFGSLLLLALVVPMIQTGLQIRMMQESDREAARLGFSILSLSTAVIRAAGYICLLIAIFAERPAEPVTRTP